MPSKNLMQMNNIEKGNDAEIETIKHLVQKGYVLLAKNWRFGHQEIDIIMKDNNTIVFVEVKMRSTDYFGNPEKAVGYKKQLFIAKAAEAYLFQQKHNGESRFDICSVLVKHGKYVVEHFVDAYYPRYF